MQIADFCTATGLGRDTVRFYIKRGLLTPQINSSNRYADFDSSEVERALVIKTSQALGFTLKEIADLSAEWEASGKSLTWQIKLMQARLAELDTQARKLKALRRYFSDKVRWLEAGATGEYPQLPAGLRPPGAEAASTCVPTPKTAKSASPPLASRRNTSRSQRPRLKAG